MKWIQSGPARAALFCVLASLSACGDDDSATPDATVTIDAGPPDAAPVDANPDHLSARGLYSDIATKTISADAVEYTPNYPLWADGAGKRRWMILPAGTTIDSTDMDHWKFPVGTKFFKEFATEGGKLLETRLIEKLPDGKFFMGAFIWRDDASEAVLALDGDTDVLGTMHDVPSKTRCEACHGKGVNGQILGFSALQLSRDGTAPTLKSIAEAGLLTAPPPAGTDYRLPAAWSKPAQDALGYLHANCGHCHNPTGTAHKDTCLVNPDTGALSECMLLQLSISELSQAQVTKTAVLDSLLGKITHSNLFEGTPRLTPGNRDMSAIYVRPSQRGGMIQMPPSFSTEIVDDDGLAAITAFINSLN